MSLEERERVACWSAPPPGLIGECVSAGEGGSRGDGRCSARIAPCPHESVHLVSKHFYSHLRSLLLLKAMSLHMTRGGNAKTRKVA